MGGGYKRISFQERLVIEKLYKNHMNLSEMNTLAGMLNRNRVTVYREIMKNTNNGTELYNARKAQQRFLEEQNKRVQVKKEKRNKNVQRVEELLALSPTMKQKEIAEIIGCSRSTVANYMKQIRMKEEEKM